jgi:hypothetical protein
MAHSRCQQTLDSEGLNMEKNLIGLNTKMDELK